MRCEMTALPAGATLAVFCFLCFCLVLIPPLGRGHPPTAIVSEGDGPFFCAPPVSPPPSPSAPSARLARLPRGSTATDTRAAAAGTASASPPGRRTPSGSGVGGRNTRTQARGRHWHWHAQRGLHTNKWGKETRAQQLRKEKRTDQQPTAHTCSAKTRPLVRSHPLSPAALATTKTRPPWRPQPDVRRELTGQTAGGMEAERRTPRHRREAHRGVGTSLPSGVLPPPPPPAVTTNLRWANRREDWMRCLWAAARSAPSGRVAPVLAADDC